MRARRGKRLATRVTVSVDQRDYEPKNTACLSPGSYVGLWQTCWSVTVRISWSCPSSQQAGGNASRCVLDDGPRVRALPGPRFFVCEEADGRLIAAIDRDDWIATVLRA